MEALGSGIVACLRHRSSVLPVYLFLFIKIGVGGTRAKPLQSGRRPRARVLAGGLQLVTEGYIRSPPLPPTLLLDRGDTPGRPQVDLRSNPVDRFICYLLVFLRVMWKTSFFTVFRGLWRTRLSPNRAPAASVTRAARTGLIDISWVLGT